MLTISNGMNENKVTISVVIPVYNESDTLLELHERITKTLSSLNKSFEIIFVDDGSTDSTYEILKKLPGTKIIKLKRNFGQTIALSVGIKKASGDIIVTIDSDLENHPEDIPMLLQKIDEGYDLVSGWRKDRWENAKLRRKLPSAIANQLLSCVGGTKINDVGCTLKAYKKELFDDITFSGDMHRLFIPYMAKRGARIAEVPVKFTPREHGKSKYGISRILDVLVDIVAFYFFEKFHNKPMRFFGTVGMFSFMASFLSFILMVALRFTYQITFIATPLPTLAVTFGIVGFQLVLMGLIAELIHRTNKENHQNSNYYIKEEITCAE